MSLNSALDDCLSRLANDEGMASCLSRYPEYAQELALLLRAAVQLRQLPHARMSQAQMLRGRVRLREALAESRPGRQPFLRPLFRWQPAFALVMVLSVAGLAAFGALSSSRPGAWAYGLRTAAESFRAQVQISPADRVSEELAIAERRLNELESQLLQSGQLSQEALQALLRADELATEQAYALPDTDQEVVASVFIRQLARLEALASLTPVEQIALDLRAATERIQQLLETLQRAATPEKPAPAPAATPTALPTIVPAPTSNPFPGTLPIVTATPVLQ